MTNRVEVNDQQAENTDTTAMSRNALGGVLDIQNVANLINR